MLLGYILIALGLLLIGWCIFLAQLRFIFKTFWKCYYEVKEEQENN